MAFPTGWPRRCALVIQSSQVSENLTNFPVLITEDCLPSEIFDADGPHCALNGGGDIRFSSDAAGTTQLACEIVRFVTDNDPANGIAQIWVKVPSISSSSDTTIYIWYGKSGESQPAQSDTYGAQNVWDSDFEGVWHLEVDPSTSSPQEHDSTSNERDGTAYGTWGPSNLVDGVVGKALNFSYANAYINSSFSTNFTAALSISCWMNINNWPASGELAHIVTKNQFYSSAHAEFPIAIALTDAGYIQGRFSRGNDFTADLIVDTDDPVSTGNWVYVCITFDSSSNGYLYIDGTEEDSGATSFTLSTNARNWLFGRAHEYGGGVNKSDFDGRIDEVRISSAVRSSGWISTEYNNQSSPATFVIEGSPFAMFTTAAPTTAASSTAAPTTISYPWTTAGPTTAPPTLVTTPAPTVEPTLTTCPPSTSAPTTLFDCEKQDYTSFTRRFEYKGPVDYAADEILFENWRNRIYEHRLYKDFGANYFDGDFEHQFDFEINYSTSMSEVGIWALTNEVGDRSTWASPRIQIYVQGYTRALMVEVYESSNTYINSSHSLSPDTTYYFRIIRDETAGVLSVEVFTDEARTVRVINIEIALTENNDFQYLYGIFGNDAGTYNYAQATGRIANLCIWDYIRHGLYTTAAPVITTTAAAPTTAAPPTTLPPTVVAATIPCCTITPRTFAPTTELPSTRDMPRAKTICGFNGQIIMGNIMGTWYDCYENSVAWSDIGHSDFTLDESQNIAGYMHMPWEGEVYRVYRLGNFVMVYGDNGVAALQPAIEPEPTFGLVELDGLIGIAGREAWCGNFQKHYFIDRAGSLWEIDTQMQIKKHDYREYLAPLMASGTLVMSLNEGDDEIYISNGTAAYIKTPQGLTATYQLVKSMRNKDGTLFATLDEAADDSFVLETDIFDMGLRGLKTLTTVEAGITQEQDDTENVEVAIKWRSDKTAPFTQTGWQVVNPQGALTFFVTAAEFKLLMRCATANDLKLDYLNVRYKVTDKRTQRGMSPTQTGKESAGVN